MRVEHIYKYANCNKEEDIDSEFLEKFENLYLELEKNYKDIISQEEFSQIKTAFPQKVLDNYKFDINDNKYKSLLDTIAHSRNDLAHANSQKTFKDIKQNVKEVLNQYREVCINETI